MTPGVSATEFRGGNSFACRSSPSTPGLVVGGHEHCPRRISAQPVASGLWLSVESHRRVRGTGATATPPREAHPSPGFWAVFVVDQMIGQPCRRQAPAWLASASTMTCDAGACDRRLLPMAIARPSWASSAVTSTALHLAGRWDEPRNSSLTFSMLQVLHREDHRHFGHDPDRRGRRHLTGLGSRSRQAGHRRCHGQVADCRA